MCTVLQQYRADLWDLVHSGYIPGGGSDPTSHLLFDLLDSVPFLVLVANDENRVSDVFDRRCYWSPKCCGEPEILCKPCSVLEIMIVMSHMLSFLCTGVVEDSSLYRWFYEMIDNLGLRGKSPEEQLKIVDGMVNRRYDASGKGSLFPVKNEAQNQKRSELWMQLNTYVIEKYL